MDRDRLERYLAEGLSLTQIGTLENRDPSTVGYWVGKYGLTANGKAKYAPRGGIRREQLEALVESGFTIREMAEELERSQSTVRHWLRRYDLQTQRIHGRRAAALAAIAGGRKKFEWTCRKHGLTDFHAFGNGRSRCARCSCEAVSRRRRRSKDTLVGEAGGRCAICGYDRCLAALQFHHKDRKTKKFEIGGKGITRAIDALREEARKCVLLCANCHAEVEAGVTEVP